MRPTQGKKDGDLEGDQVLKSTQAKPYLKQTHFGFLC